jgi:uncharacterized protein (UPF0276 family)
MQNSPQKTYAVSGSGLGLRRDLLDELEENFPDGIDFMEVAPENWIGIGGKLGKRFRAITEKPAPLDENFVRDVKKFLDEHNILCYSEHLSYCSDQGHLYDLMPIPFTDEAVHYVAGRIKRVQDILERKIAIENVSYYAAPGKEMDEINFIKNILEEADCELLLDVNNIYVNSVNHHYDPMKFLAALPSKRIAYCHVAGHYNEAEDLIVDTHGADVIDPVWDILDKAYELFGSMPTLLERDFNFPPMDELMQEVHTIRNLQSKWGKSSRVVAKAS